MKTPGSIAIDSLDQFERAFISSFGNAKSSINSKNQELKKKFKQYFAEMKDTRKITDVKNEISAIKLEITHSTIFFCFNRHLQLLIRISFLFSQKINLKNPVEKALKLYSHIEQNQTLPEQKEMALFSYVNALKELQTELKMSFSSIECNDSVIAYKNSWLPNSLKSLIEMGLNFTELDHRKVREWNYSISKYQSSRDFNDKVALERQKVSFYIFLVTNHLNLFKSPELATHKILDFILKETSFDLNDAYSCELGETYLEYQEQIAKLRTKLLTMSLLLVKEKQLDVKPYIQFLNLILVVSIDSFLKNEKELCNYLERQKNLYQEEKELSVAKWIESDITIEDIRFRSIGTALDRVLKESGFGNEKTAAFFNGGGLGIKPAFKIPTFVAQMIPVDHPLYIRKKMEQLIVIHHYFGNLTLALENAQKQKAHVYYIETLKNARWVLLELCTDIMSYAFERLRQRNFRMGTLTLQKSLEAIKTVEELRKPLRLEARIKMPTNSALVNSYKIQFKFSKGLDNSFVDLYQLQDKYVIGKWNPQKNWEWVNCINFTSWGRLFQEDINWWNSFVQLIGLDFMSQLSRMEKELIEWDQKTIKDKDRISILELSKCQLLLNRILELISLKQRELKRNSYIGSSEGVALQSEINILESAFDNFLNRHKSIDKPESSLWWKCVEGLFFKGFNEYNINNIWGYSCFKYTPSSDFEFQKLCADKGFNITKDLLEFLPCLTANPLQLCSEIKNLANGFIKWADRHPEMAETMVSDVFISIMSILDMDFLTTFKANTDIHIYFRAFTRHLGNRFIKNEIEIEELKFVALSKMMRMAPVIASTLQSTAKIMQVGLLENLRYSFISTLFGIPATYLSDLCKSMILQQLSDVFTEQPLVTELTNSVLAFMQGEPVHKILEGKSRIALIELATEMWHAFQNPELFQEALFKEATVWWQTIIAPQQGIERTCRIVVQIVCPLASLLASGCICVGLFSVTGGCWIAIPLCIGTLVAGLSLTCKTYALINSFTKTRTQVEVELFNTSQKTDRLMQEKLIERTSNYLSELNLQYALPHIEVGIKNEIILELEPLVNKWCDILEHELNFEMNRRSKLMPKDLGIIFAKKLNIKELKANIKLEEELNDEKLFHACFLIKQKLEENWFKKNVNALFAADLKLLFAAPEKKVEAVQKEILSVYDSDTQEVIKDFSKMPAFFKNKMRGLTQASDRELDCAYEGFKRLSRATS